MRRYKLTRDYLRPGATSASVIIIASYATLGAAVKAARREFARTSNNSLEIRRDGKKVRCLYLDGLPSSWTAREEAAS